MELELAIANEIASRNTHTHFDYNFSNELYDTPILLDNESSQNKSEEIGFNDEKVVINAIVLDDANDELKTNLYAISDNVLNANEKSETKDTVCQNEYEVVANNQCNYNKEINKTSVSAPVTSLTLIPRNVIPQKEKNRVFKGECKGKTVAKSQSIHFYVVSNLEDDIFNAGKSLRDAVANTYFSFGYKKPYFDFKLCAQIITTVFNETNNLGVIKKAIFDIYKEKYLSNPKNPISWGKDIINWINNKEQIIEKREKEDKIQKELAEKRIIETEMFLKLNETNKEIEILKKSESNIRVENFVKSLPIEFQEKYMKYSKSNRRTFKRELEELGEENFSRMINGDIEREKLKQGRIELFKNNIKSVPY